MLLFNHGEEDLSVAVGDRIAQVSIQSTLLYARVADCCIHQRPNFAAAGAAGAADQGANEWHDTQDIADGILSQIVLTRPRFHRASAAAAAAAGRAAHLGGVRHPGRPRRRLSRRHGPACPIPSPPPPPPTPHLSNEP